MSKLRVASRRRLQIDTRQPFRTASWAACTAVRPPPTTSTRLPRFSPWSLAWSSVWNAVCAGRCAKAGGTMAGPGTPSASTTDLALIELPSDRPTSKAPSAPPTEATLLRTKVWGSLATSESQKSRKSCEEGRLKKPACACPRPLTGFQDSASVACSSASRPCRCANSRRLQASKVSGWAMAGERSQRMPSAAKRARQAASHGCGSTTQTDGRLGGAVWAARLAWSSASSSRQ
mmetsp:Transcript_27880/g.88607  ORF Transcript_27880/g.88607 Transcript_27880/m.88607 type:complete len:233 (-) Transcript_27880:146-844(-)